MQKIFLSPPHMSGKELDYIKVAFDENYITTMGKNVTDFQNKIKSITKAKYALATVNATSAIHLSLIVAGVTKNDLVLSSSFTFIGSVAPILYQNAKPIFIDSDTSSWNLDPNLLEYELKRRKKQNKKMPKALIVTHLYGQMAKIQEIKKICKEYSVF